MIPNLKQPHGAPFFSNCWLIDSLERKLYAVPVDFNRDSLLRVDELIVTNNGENLIFKTGRIRPYEKKMFWEKNSNYYFENDESLIIVNTEQFINNVKKEIDLHHFVADFSNESGCLKLITTKNEDLIYAKGNFQSNITSVNCLNMITKENKTILETNQLFVDIEYFGTKIYGKYEVESGRDISFFDFESKEIVRIPYQGVIYLDKEFLVSSDRGDKRGTYNISIKNLKSDKVKNYANKRFEYDYQKNSLILY